MAVTHVSNRALDEIQEITESLERRSPAYARLFVNELFRRIYLLERFPLLRRMVPERQDERLRELLFKQYRIFYRIHPDDSLSVASVQSGTTPFREIS